MADAARRHAAATKTVQIWRDRFLAGGRQALLEQKVPGTATAETVPERRMRLENEQLKRGLDPRRVRRHPANPRAGRS